LLAVYPEKIRMTTLTIIFAKEPVAGQVKTRLTPPLPPEDASRLYHSFLEDILPETVRLPGLELALAFTPAGARDFFRHLAPEPVRLFPQEGHNLGERQARAFAWGFAAGFETVLVRGSDTPDLPGDLLLEARDRLAAGPAAVVLGPCPDGGYYLIGLKAPHPELFKGLHWSTGAVLADTLKRARELSLKVHLLPAWPDIDTYADLLAFLERPHPPGETGWRSDRTARELVATMAAACLSGTYGGANAGNS
jgi:rSAM/selenodomain-associated transferase 1